MASRPRSPWKQGMARKHTHTRSSSGRALRFGLVAALVCYMTARGLQNCLGGQQQQLQIQTSPLVALNPPEVVSTAYSANGGLRALLESKQVKRPSRPQRCDPLDQNGHPGAYRGKVTVLTVQRHAQVARQPKTPCTQRWLSACCAWVGRRCPARPQGRANAEAGSALVDGTVL